MTKVEFLERLEEALNNDLTGTIVRENIAYYDQYISGEVRKGRLEQEVLDELGDPWVIAQTIIDTQENAKEQGYYKTQQNYQNSYQRTYQDSYEANETQKKWPSSIGKWIFTVIGILGILFIVVTVVGGLLSLFMPILIPIVIVMVISRLIKRR